MDVKSCRSLTEKKEESMGELKCREKLYCLWRQIMPYLAIIVRQFAVAGVTISVKFALDEGMSPFVLVVYRHLLATLIIAPFALWFERDAISQLSWLIMLYIAAMGLLEPVLDQNLYFLGIKYTSATFSAAMGNLLPCIIFIMALVLRLEKLKLRDIRSIAKVVGTLVSVSGAMTMTFYKGSSLLKISSTMQRHSVKQTISSGKSTVIGALLMVLSIFSWAGFMVLQAIALNRYPFKLTISALMCLVGSIFASIVALSKEHFSKDKWKLSLDAKLFVVLYTAFIGSAMTLWLQGIVMQKRGPVFVTSFSPLGMVIVGIIGVYFMGEQLYIGSLVGLLLIVIGLYIVLWGKSKDRVKSMSSRNALVSVEPDNSGIETVEEKVTSQV